MPKDVYSGKSAYRGSIAANYDEDRVVEPIWKIEQDFISNWSETIEPEKKILDAPAGTGRFLGYFHRQGLKVTALDISEDMVAEIRKNYSRFTGDIKMMVGDTEALPFADNAFDYIISWRFFHLIPSAVAERVLREFRRTCNGTVVIQVFAVNPPPYSRVMRRVYDSLLRPFDRSTQLSGSRSWSHIENFYYSEKELRALFAKVGFRVSRSLSLNSYREMPNRVFFLS